MDERWLLLLLSAVAAALIAMCGVPARSLPGQPFGCPLEEFESRQLLRDPRAPWSNLKDLEADSSLRTPCLRNADCTVHYLTMGCCQSAVLPVRASRSAWLDRALSTCKARGANCEEHCEHTYSRAVCNLGRCELQ